MHTSKRFRVGVAKPIQNKAKKAGPYVNAGLSRTCRPMLEGMTPGGDTRFIPLSLLADGDYRRLSSNVTGYLASMYRSAAVRYRTRRSADGLHCWLEAVPPPVEFKDAAPAEEMEAVPPPVEVKDAARTPPALIAELPTA